MTVVTGRRTTLAAGRELEYDRIHAAIPPVVEAALRSSGVINWHIWRDGTSLFHSVETRDGYEQMLSDIGRLGPVDPEWDLIISSLLSSEPGADSLLPLVWSL